MEHNEYDSVGSRICEDWNVHSFNRNDFMDISVIRFFTHSWLFTTLTFSFLYFSQEKTSSSGSEEKRSPADFLKAVLGRPVNVKLNSGTDYKGVLACLDGYMNIAMEQTEEYQDGQLKAKYGDCFIRGNNGAFFVNVTSSIFFLNHNSKYCPC